MQKIFDDADDKNVRKIKLYAKASDAYAYSDAECKNKVDAAAMQKAFKVGAVIVLAGVEYLPVAMEVKSGVATMTYVTADTTTSTTAVLATVASKEYSAS